MNKQHLHKLAVMVIVVATLLLVTLSAGAASSGTCGTNVKWTLDSTDLLTRSGTGGITPNPWATDNIRKVVIKTGVKSIDSDAFSGLMRK